MTPAAPYRLALFSWQGQSISEPYGFVADAIEAADRAIQPITWHEGRRGNRHAVIHRPAWQTAIVFADGEPEHMYRADAGPEWFGNQA